ncbi:uncharacterized protein LOC144859648 [Branchiostoma floridae x Branchiostoma japonicum]
MKEHNKEQKTVSLDRSVLNFFAPYDRRQTQVVRVCNPSDHHVCFIVKSCAPGRCYSDPNMGVIGPKCCIKITFELKENGYDPKEKIKHKFHIEVLPKPDGVNPVGRGMYEDLFKNKRPAILHLRCAFTGGDLSEDSDLETDGRFQTGLGRTLSCMKLRRKKRYRLFSGEGAPDPDEFPGFQGNDEYHTGMSNSAYDSKNANQVAIADVVSKNNNMAAEEEFEVEDDDSDGSFDDNDINDNGNELNLRLMEPLLAK